MLAANCVDMLSSVATCLNESRPLLTHEGVTSRQSLQWAILRAGTQ